MDPTERHNVIDEPAYQAVRGDLTKRLDDWMRETADPLLDGPVPPPPGSVISPRHAYNPVDPLIKIPKE